MAINVLNICFGPADLYIGAYGATEPLDSAATIAGGPPGAGWTGVGGTEGGITFEVGDTYNDWTVREMPLAIGARMTARSITVRTQMKEATLTNLNSAMNSLMVSTTSSAYTVVEPQATALVTQPSSSVKSSSVL